MIFDIEEIYEEGLNFDVLEPKAHFKMDSPDCVLAEDVKVQGKLEKSGQLIRCQGSLQTKLSVGCTRCLANFSFTVNARLSVHFIPRVEKANMAGETELTDQDVEQEFYEEGRIDLSPPVRDLILLSLPQVRLCREDCAGLCPGCGANLNENKCGCNGKDSCDPRLEVLQQLKDKLK